MLRNIELTWTHSLTSLHSSGRRKAPSWLGHTPIFLHVPPGWLLFSSGYLQMGTAEMWGWRSVDKINSQGVFLQTTLWPWLHRWSPNNSNPLENPCRLPLPPHSSLRTMLIMTLIEFHLPKSCQRQDLSLPSPMPFVLRRGSFIHWLRRKILSPESCI